jgi:hypothetical protein
MTKRAATRINPRATLLATTLAVALCAGSSVSADEGNKFGNNVVQVPKTGARCADDPRCHTRWHPAIQPVASANSGDIAVFGTRDAFDHSLNRNSTAADVVALNLNLVHPLTAARYSSAMPKQATCSR